MDDVDRRGNNLHGVYAILKSLHKDASDEELAEMAVKKEEQIEKIFSELKPDECS